MSYERRGTVVFTEIDSLRNAVMKNPNLEWVEGAKTYKHEYNARSCSHKIKVKGRNSEGYEIGVVENPDGTGYNLVWDSSGNFEPIIGEGASNIRTDYTRETSREWAARKGYVMTETVDSEGLIVLTLDN